MAKNVVVMAQQAVDSVPMKSSIVMDNAHDVAYSFGRKVLQSADALPFDQLAKLSAEGTLALGAVPAATICTIIFGLATIAVLKFIVTRSSMGLAMRARDARDIFA